MADPTLFHWLVSGQVVTKDQHGKERQKGFNAMLTTVREAITRSDLAKAQDAMMHSFIDKAPQIKGAEIIDVYIQGTSLLGRMTKQEFHHGFAQELHS